VRDSEVREAALDAIASGRIPPGGPSELAARGLLDDAPDGYWERWTLEAAERIRSQERRAAR
jgi:hypothetical protein